MLDDNDLTGPIPGELGNLASLTTLSLGGNELTGPIPPELGNLARLRLASLTLHSNNLSGPIPPELGKLTSLTTLWLYDNDLTGPIPGQLGNLARLASLRLHSNNLSGPIPPEIGKLTSLTTLWLYANDLTGPIPGELGNLTSLTNLGLNANDLTGPIPGELGSLTSLTNLGLNNNALTGAIPGELGNLTSLTNLWLNDNDLTGPIPGQLGKLSTLERLSLADNDLAGAIPSEWSGMLSLRELHLGNNSGMAGPLPDELVALRQLEALLVGGTGLCAPANAGFKEWLTGVYRSRISTCTDGALSMAYLVQTVQSRDFPVPLIAEEKALLRVFPMAVLANNADIPAVRAKFYLNGGETHVVDIPGKSGPIPTAVYEGNLSISANAEIPGHVIQPGLEMVIEVDPEGTLDNGLGVAKRIPEAGRLAVDVRAMPLFDLTVIPFIWSQTRDSSTVELVKKMAADPENQEITTVTRTVLPVGNLDVTAHEPVLSSTNNGYVIVAETRAIRVMEGGTSHYMGMIDRPTGCTGVAELGGKVSFSQPVAVTVVHELGHNLNLLHAPCGRAGGPDPSFPYPYGSIGAWGHDFRTGRLVSPIEKDVMSYCGLGWISDYHFTNAMRYRLFDEDPLSAAAAASARSLLLWGGVDSEGKPYLEPAFVVDAPPALPDSAGEYMVTGRTASGTELFRLAFTMPELADGDENASFAFALPVRSAWEGSLASITLSGPGGSFTLDADSDLSVTVLRNPRTGQVRGILRDLPDPATAAAFAAGPGLEVLFSRGIPDTTAWGR